MDRIISARFKSSTLGVLSVFIYAWLVGKFVAVYLIKFPPVLRVSKASFAFSTVSGTCSKKQDQENPTVERLETSRTIGLRASSPNRSDSHEQFILVTGAAIAVVRTSSHPAIS